ncbi:MAG: hypothetical protein NVS9B2_00920 [Steroidobacteraceae bacterium]
MNASIPQRAAGCGKIALLALASVAGIMGFGTWAAAGPSIEVHRAVVKYNPASLANELGVNDLYRRITVAARQVCPEASYRHFEAQYQVQQCRAQAVARAIQQIDNPRPAAVHAVRAKNG